MKKEKMKRNRKNYQQKKTKKVKHTYNHITLKKKK